MDLQAAADLNISDEKKKELGRVSRRVDNRVFFKLDAYGYLPRARFHLWLLDVDSHEIQQLTDSEIHDEKRPVWSPDGQFIAFFSNRTEQPDLSPGKTDLFLFNLEKQSFEKLETPEGDKRDASFSPDGRKIAYLGQKGLKADYKNIELWVLDLDQERTQ